jgi:fatty acid-binding protein DegV
VLYLCVGSVFTGNYAVAMEWKKSMIGNRLTALDTGAASGRLGVIALATQRHLLQTRDMDKTIAFAGKRSRAARSTSFSRNCNTWPQAAGSPRPALFRRHAENEAGHFPQPEGAKKMGVVRNRKEQISMAQDKLAAALGRDDSALIMLEYSDNSDMVAELRETIGRLYPQADIILQPLSLTSGAHMGPGTWGVAFLKL